MDVIQIYKRLMQFTKTDYNPESRKMLEKWPASVESKNGFLSQENLFLPIEYQRDRKMFGADLIVVQDIPGYYSTKVMRGWDNAGFPQWFAQKCKAAAKNNNKELAFFQGLNYAKKFEIFKLLKHRDQYYEIMLNASEHPFYFEKPNRNDHKFANLKQGDWLRYRVNGRSDFTLSGRQERAYFEFDFVFHFIGKARNIKFLELNKISSSKAISIQQCKTVDERKILY